MSGPKTSNPHAEVTFKGGRVFVEGSNAKSATFLGDVEIRGGVAYMVSPGSVVSFGEAGSNAYEVLFEEETSAANAGFMEMLMKGMAQSDEVKKQLEEGM